MRVFRLCTEDELTSLSLGETIGKEYNETESSTHTYEKGEKYLHFYYDKVFAYFKEIDVGEYLCEFQFPNDYDKFRGKGSYKTRTGYEHFVNVDELSLKSELVTYDNIVSISRVVDDYNPRYKYEKEIYGYVDPIDKEKHRELVMRNN